MENLSETTDEEEAKDQGGIINEEEYESMNRIDDDKVTEMIRGTDTFVSDIGESSPSAVSLKIINFDGENDEVGMEEDLEIEEGEIDDDNDDDDDDNGREESEGKRKSVIDNVDDKEFEEEKAEEEGEKYEREEEKKEREEEEEEEEEGEEESEEEEEGLEEEEKELIDYAYLHPKSAKKITSRVKSDNDLSKIPSEVCGDRNAMISMLRELFHDHPNLLLRNKYLEYKCSKHLYRSSRGAENQHRMRDEGVSILEDDAEKERYMIFLSRYKKDSEMMSRRDNRVKESLEEIREKLKALLSSDAEIFAEFISKETAIAVDLIFATTGRKLTPKRVEDMIRRQTARRNRVAHARFTFIRQWYKFEDIDARIHRLETLGPGMRIGDYEAELVANLTYKTRIDERNKALQKARDRVCGIMAAITHGKVKLSYLSEEIDRRNRSHDGMIKSVHKRREELSTIRGELSRTRNRYLKRRETAGLMLALPTLREIEKMIKLHGDWKERVKDLQTIIQKMKIINKKLIRRKEKEEKEEDDPEAN